MKKKVICAGLVSAALLITGCSDASHPANAITSIGYTEINNITGGKLDTEYSYTVKYGETLHIKDGETLLINGLLNCKDGGNIVIDKGGSLMINGQVELSGCLTLDRGGELLLAEGSKLYGSGTASISSFNDIDCAGDFTAHIAPPEPVTKNGITTVGDVLIVNKKYSLPRDYGSELNPEAASALDGMRADSGYEMPLISGFRSYEKQESVFAAWCARDGVERASTYSARPGHSEHQSGLAMDITSLEQSYGITGEGKWVAENCYKYGLILRYPRGKYTTTGYIYEPWHLRYLGKSTAKLVHDSGLTLEEFLGVEG